MRRLVKKKKIDNRGEEEGKNAYMVKIKLPIRLVFRLAEAAEYEGLSVEDYIEKKVKATEQDRKYLFMLGMS